LKVLGIELKTIFDEDEDSVTVAIDSYLGGAATKGVIELDAALATLATP
jgi:hypothetical protein